MDANARLDKIKKLRDELERLVMDDELESVIESCKKALELYRMLMNLARIKLDEKEEQIGIRT